MDNKNYYPIELDSQGAFTLVNGGTAPSPCCITFIPQVDFMNLTIKGLSKEPIKVTNIKANDTLVIDGENRSITLNDRDYFSNYDAWEFPKLEPGINHVEINNGALASIAIEYTKRYI